jgi:uncharacterized protein
VVIDRKWTASVVIAVHDKDENPLANATVYGSWTAGSSRTVQCTTAADGICTITSNQINKNFTSTTFSVTDVTHPTNTYFPADNQDPDGDSDGTNITIAQP